MTKILVTGGAGNVGSALVEKLLYEKNNFVTVADNLSTGLLNKLPAKNTERFKFIKSDVNQYRDIAEILISSNFDYVFHLAAVVGVQRTQENPVRVLHDIEGIKNILDISKNTSVKRVFFSSSSEVYGEPVTLPQHEHTTPLNSRIPYAIVKNVGESFCKSYQQEYGLDYTIFRFFNTYGPNQSTDFVLPRFISAALKNEDILIYGDGMQTRTFTYIDDNIDTILACLYQNQIINDVINIGNHQIITVLDLAKTIIDITNSKSNIVHIAALKDGDMTRRQPDNQKMLQLLNRNLIPLEEGVIRMLNDIRFLNSIRS
jgi:UDP-glucuronate decarboxylase